MHLHASIVTADISFIAQTSIAMFPEGIFSGKLYSPTPLASCMALFAIEVSLYSYALIIDSLQYKLKDTDINVESAMICKYNMM